MCAVGGSKAIKLSTHTLLVWQSVPEKQLVWPYMYYTCIYKAPAVCIVTCHLGYVHVHVYILYIHVNRMYHTCIRNRPYLDAGLK